MKIILNEKDFRKFRIDLLKKPEEGERFYLKYESN